MAKLTKLNKPLNLAGREVAYLEQLDKIFIHPKDVDDLLKGISDSADKKAIQGKLQSKKAKIADNKSV